jgi:hypothetical protein
MADTKKTELSVVIRATDAATAVVRGVTKRIKEATRPMTDLKKAASELRETLGENLGVNSVLDGFKGVGGAVKDLLGKLFMIGGAIAAATVGVLSLIDHYDKLGDTADRLGTSADFLAAIRYAAERAGAPLEAVDGSLQTLVTNMGAAKAGTGKMLKFLNQISPTLARQVTAAHSLEEALGLLADATEKIPDAARRSKLAAATLGDPALAPLLARGSKGIQELLTRYAELAGAQGEAAESAGKTDDALKDLHASTDGVKAALVTGLAPALTEIIGKMTAWFVSHREDIRQWADDIGRKLPGAVDEVVRALKSAIGWVGDIVDSIGGWKVAALGVAAVMTGPLLSAIGTLGIALIATPFGQFVLGAAAAVAIMTKLIGQIEQFYASLDTKNEKLTEDVALHAAGKLSDSEFDALHPGFRADAKKLDGFSLTSGQDIDDFVANGAKPTATSLLSMSALDRLLASAPAAAAAGPLAPQQEVRLKVDFANAPKGTRVSAERSSGGPSVDMTVGYQLGGGL